MGDVAAAALAGGGESTGESTGDWTGELTAALARERPRLVRLCARLTGDWDAAEDLAQETLAQAWRSRAKLEYLGGLPAWLSAIARNLCLRWLRAHARDLGRLASAEERGEDAGESTIERIPAVEGDLAAGLERGELADLLDRALALLPSETRVLLIDAYVRERPHAELAARLGLGAGVLRARLHRGRLALRRVLANDLRADAVTAGILPEETTSWQPTRIWCPFCGLHPLETALDRDTGRYSYRCAGDCQPGTMLVHGGQDVALLRELSSPKAILTRHCLDNYSGYRTALADALAGRENTCPTCGGPVAARRPQPDGSGGAPATPLFVHGVYFHCPVCGPMSHASPWHLTLQSPAALRFWRRYPRMRALPTRELEFGGRAAVVTGFESRGTAARVEIVSARDTYEVLAVFGDGEALAEHPESFESLDTSSL